MIFSKKQIRLLKAFYQKKTILYRELPKYHTVEHSPLIRTLTTEHLIKNVEFFPKDGYPSYTKAYQITDKGEATYENLVFAEKRFFWTDFRSWLAIAISVIAIIVSVVIAKIR